MLRTELLNRVENVKCRSAWQNGVKQYAIDLLNVLDCEDIIESPTNETEKVLLNGCDSWSRYSASGTFLVSDYDIAHRLCTKSELKLTREGERRPNKREDWIDTQTRALRQAYWMILDVMKEDK